MTMAIRLKGVRLMVTANGNAKLQAQIVGDQANEFDTNDWDDIPIVDANGDPTTLEIMVAAP